MIKLNQLDHEGFYVVDYVTDGDDRPSYWTSDLLGDGFYKARYVDGKRNDETGEWHDGSWIECGGPSQDELILNATATLMELKSKASEIIYQLSLRLMAGRSLTESESKTLNSWMDYSDSLDALDLTTAPKIEWPKKPE